MQNQSSDFCCLAFMSRHRFFSELSLWLISSKGSITISGSQPGKTLLKMSGWYLQIGFTKSHHPARARNVARELMTCTHPHPFKANSPWLDPASDAGLPLFSLSR
jgi:hypothetical protein